jgi:glycosyltransferase involved in cell wall biosynthesis
VAGVDVLVVSIGATGGWRAAARELAGSIERAGASVELVTASQPGRVRTMALTDYVEARAARSAALSGIAAHDPGAIVYCSVTAALLWPRPGAVSLDSIAAENRPGRHGIWQRPVERHRLRQTPLVLAWSERSLEPLAGSRYAEVVVVPPPVDGTPDPHQDRDIAAITYAGDPVKRRLPLVLEAWRRARRPDEMLVVTGVDGIQPVEGVRVVGRLAAAEFHALLSRARVFVAAPSREDFGIAALEALAHGCVLVTTPARGPYPALGIARELDPRLVGDDLRAAIRVALDDPDLDYAARATELLAPFRRRHVDQTVAERVLPRLLP